MADLSSTRIFGKLTVIHGIDIKGDLRVEGSIEGYIEEAPKDGSAYVRVDGQWKKLSDYLYAGK